MPRPIDIRQELWTEWEDAAANQISGMPISPNMQKTFKEVIIAGCYVAYRLGKIHCTEDLAVQICLAFGQKCLGRDPWEVAEQTIKDYKQGKWDKPGPELYQKVNADLNLFKKFTKRQKPV